MDSLSDALHGFRFAGALFIDAELSAPWAVMTPSAREIAAVLARGASHIIPYHLVLDGECLVCIDGHAPIALRSGDLAMFPHGDVHVLADATTTHVQVLSRGFVEDVLKKRTVLPVRYGGGGVVTRMLCGFFGMDQSCGEHLVNGLPPVLSAPVGRKGGQDLLAVLARKSIEETVSKRPGSDAVICRLSEVLFVDALRTIIAQDDAQLSGWLAGLRDPGIRLALTKLHARPEYGWDVASLANLCGMSRSKFVTRFASVVGAPPIKYLANWRMTLAARDLRHDDASIMQIADRYGYGSEASFTKAFRRHFHAPPAAFRRDQLGSAT
jgi:AraC-like DNA-binding protein